MKNIVLKRLLLIENILLLLATVPSILLLLCNVGVSVGFLIFSIACYIFYPLILLTFLAGLLWKAVEIKNCKGGLILFGINLVTSFIGLLTMLYRVAASLEGF